MQQGIDIKDRFSELISQYAELFQCPIVLNSELTQMFPRQINETEIPEKTQKKPFRYVPGITDIAGKFVPRKPILITPNTKFNIYPTKNDSFILPIKLQNGHHGFLISSTYDYYIYDSILNHGYYIDKLKNLELNGKKITIGDKIFTLSTTVKENSRKIISELQEFIPRVLAEKNLITYKNFFESLGIMQAFPPVNEFTLPYYRTLFTNNNFLLLYSRVIYTKDDMKPLAQAFLNITGPEFPAFYRFMAYDEYKTYKSPSLAMRGNNFFVSLTTYIVGQDPEYIKFLDSLSLQSETLVEDFIKGVEIMDLSPRSRIVLNAIYNEGKRTFPETDCKRFGVSGVLFLRLMSPVLMLREPRFSNKIQPLTPIFNLMEKGDQNAVNKLRVLIDRYSVFPENYVVEPNNSYNEKDIETLIQMIPKSKDELIRAATHVNFSDIYSQYLSLPPV
ncbi:hypothetical protein TVAG_411200 [Trichomonas vaginalis G3]|uniref:Uncharacterized protein n=1 Tax=Trichomonas vaginalis (strain ATCC PRA-98 / G3) TaxID=412133 RepID=A2DXM5_TRIV3|nr:GTPase activation domain, GAP family [Trichomonas vaginalis G3]EAY14854.1 hypothetical protein TVAG_411200 [Trichomonas vaginalis G3]KAI5541165.1 GTPase activation domain, GAP family [Trichomonas vaginalis G3]|eukprot:XP_001327077.1 hypothetical protein [Trichomonas vaginalis G3]